MGLNTRQTTRCLHGAERVRRGAEEGRRWRSPPPSSSSSGSHAASDTPLADDYLSALSMISSIEPHTLLYIFLPATALRVGERDRVARLPQGAGRHAAAPGARARVPFAMLAGVALMALVAPRRSTPRRAFLWAACLLLGTITSATDPVAVVATLRELGAKPSLSTTIPTPGRRCSPPNGDAASTVSASSCSSTSAPPTEKESNCAAARRARRRRASRFTSSPTAASTLPERRLGEGSPHSVMSPRQPPQEFTPRRRRRAVGGRRRRWRAPVPRAAGAAPTVRSSARRGSGCGCRRSGYCTRRRA